ncbi:hypothetical protein [Methylobacterium aquaticum]|uniref:hypothetical protein n=1 Tax=Methylobacterium aquaticum TaxID=270351 RepID=UPI0019334C03|nr:hypothetical protein [Methylobacterium aquaticum]QRE74434.1 hypothetical protein F1D61_13205 [Methylobacterium aquaticum]
MMAPRIPKGSSRTERQCAAIKAAAFRKNYPRSQRLNAEHYCSVSANWVIPPFKIMPCARDWLDEHCPGWGLLYTSVGGSYIGFAKPHHTAWFEVAASMMLYREQWRSRQDATAREDREDRTKKLAHFRAEYPVTHRLRRAAQYRIWQMCYHPILLEDVREWLDENAPGWSQFPKTRFIGFADPDHAICFKMVWGGVQ